MRSKSAEREARGMGFKDEQTALNTLEILDGHDILYQYSIITDFIRRAKSTLEDTRDEKKLADLRDGLEIFEDWLADFEENNRMKERLPYLPIGTVNVFYDHAKKYGVWDDEFFEAYKNTDGDYEDLCEMEVPGGGGITWDVERNRRLKEIICKIKNEHISLYEDVRFSNFRQPTKEHTQCIAYSHTVLILILISRHPLTNTRNFGPVLPWSYPSYPSNVIFLLNFGQRFYARDANAIAIVNQCLNNLKELQE